MPAHEAVHCLFVHSLSAARRVRRRRRYGVWGGYLVTLAGCMTGAAISFVLAKSGVRGWVRGKVGTESLLAKLCLAMGEVRP
eukprot:SAG22_NODE_1637_length_3917_cov_1.975642_1_plen_82_part_00